MASSDQMSGSSNLAEKLDPMSGSTDGQIEKATRSLATKLTRHSSKVLMFYLCLLSVGIFVGSEVEDKIRPGVIVGDMSDMPNNKLKQIYADLRSKFPKADNLTESVVIWCQTPHCDIMNDANASMAARASWFKLNERFQALSDQYTMGLLSWSSYYQMLPEELQSQYISADGSTMLVNYAMNRTRPSDIVDITNHVRSYVEVLDLDRDNVIGGVRVACAGSEALELASFDSLKVESVWHQAITAPIILYILCTRIGSWTRSVLSFLCIFQSLLVAFMVTYIISETVMQEMKIGYNFWIMTFFVCMAVTVDNCLLFWETFARERWLGRSTQDAIVETIVKSSNFLFVSGLPVDGVRRRALPS